MKIINKVIIIVLIILGFYYLEKQILSDKSIFNKIIFSEISNSKKNNAIFQEIATIVTNKDFNNIISLLDNKTVDQNITKIINISSPLIYIYNTHDKENYSTSGLETYNIEANVKTASYIFQEQLKKYNISSIVEERSPTDAAKNQGLTYPYSYRYSKEYALEYMEKYPSLKYFIDIHRDGVSKEVSTIQIANKNYAKLMFVIGTEYESSSENVVLIKTIENYIEEKYPDLLRSTYLNPNDNYNQDISPNCFLIEVGGNNNSLDEVYNSLVVLAEALASFLGEKV